jgi:hypothetical protein
MAKQAQQQLNRAYEILHNQMLRVVYHMQGLSGLQNAEIVEMYRAGWPKLEGEALEAWFVAGKIEKL